MPFCQILSIFLYFIVLIRLDHKIFPVYIALFIYKFYLNLVVLAWLLVLLFPSSSETFSVQGMLPLILPQNNWTPFKPSPVLPFSSKLLNCFEFVTWKDYCYESKCDHLNLGTKITEGKDWCLEFFSLNHNQAEIKRC